MKLFADTGSIKDIETLAALGILDGVTTNPTLLAKEPGDYRQNLKKICEEHLRGRYRIEVIDLLKNPTLARGDQILAVPTLVRKLPPPVKKIIGDFTNTERVLVGLNLVPVTDDEHAR